MQRAAVMYDGAVSSCELDSDDDDDDADIAERPALEPPSAAVLERGEVLQLDEADSDDRSPQVRGESNADSERGDSVVDPHGDDDSLVSGWRPPRGDDDD